jgi:hypothetical protein
VHRIARRERRDGGKPTVNQSSQCFDSLPRAGDLAELPRKLNEGVPDPPLETIELRARIAFGIAVCELTGKERGALLTCKLAEFDQYIRKVVCQ